MSIDLKSDYDMAQDKVHINLTVDYHEFYDCLVDGETVIDQINDMIKIEFMKHVDVARDVSLVSSRLDAAQKNSNSALVNKVVEILDSHNKEDKEKQTASEWYDFESPKPMDPDEYISKDFVNKYCGGGPTGAVGTTENYPNAYEGISGPTGITFTSKYPGTIDHVNYIKPAVSIDYIKLDSIKASPTTTKYPDILDNLYPFSVDMKSVFDEEPVKILKSDFKISDDIIAKNNLVPMDGFFIQNEIIKLGSIVSYYTDGDNKIYVIFKPNKREDGRTKMTYRFDSKLDRDKVMDDLFYHHKKWAEFNGSMEKLKNELHAANKL